MYVIQHGHVVTFPDDAPIPPGSVEIDPPEEYLERPEFYIVHMGELVRRPDEELTALMTDEPALKLTQDEIRILKGMIAAGTLAPKPKPKPRAKTTAQRKQS